MTEKVPLLPFSPANSNSIPFEIKPIESLPPIAMRPVPHRHTFYVMFWITDGSGSHYLDFEADKVQPNSLHFVGPGQVHYWDVEEEIKGYAIVFESAIFMEPADQELLDQLNCFRTVNGLSVINLAGPDIESISYLVERLYLDYTQEKFARTLSITSWLRLLLIEVQRLADVGEWVQKTAISAEKLLTNNYLDLVEEHAISQHKVEWYADELAVTVSHLSKSVKSTYGITAGAVLRNRLVLEAKRLLVHTDQTAASIALQLNFEDASYFGRFFKRETKLTPRQFRTQSPTKHQI